MKATEETRSQTSLKYAMQAMNPLLALLLRDGVTYPMLCLALKDEMLKAAQKLHCESVSKATDSGLATLTGINRKDVKVWRLADRHTKLPSPVGPAMEVFTRWISNPRYLDANGAPKALLRIGTSESFEALASSVSSDVHPRSLLQELIRLGIVQIDNEDALLVAQTVSPTTDAFVPKEGLPEMMQMMANNVGDHMRAAASNIEGARPSMLEQSIYSEPLTAESVGLLRTVVQKAWALTFKEVVAVATKCELADCKRPDATQRFRVGMFAYYGDKDPE